MRKFNKKMTVSEVAPLRAENKKLRDLNNKLYAKVKARQLTIDSLRKELQILKNKETRGNKR